VTGCSHRSGVKKYCKANDVSTGNLMKHANMCQPKASSASTLVMQKFTGGYSCEGFCWLLLPWIICKNWPYALVEDEELGNIFWMLNSKVQVPCTNTLVGDIKYTPNTLYSDGI
jgi:hypothetical protein